jgi:uncharacterized protein YecE (DUF72 family)
MDEILVGTASWADKSLLDSGLFYFYPKQAQTAEARLRYYSTQFRLVEVDSSYYAMSAPQVAQSWAERTPETFVLDVKAFRIFTQHQTPPNVLPKDIREALGPLAEKKNVYYVDLPQEVMEEMWRRLRLAPEQLRHAGKLGAVLFQFPPWFLYRRSNLEHIARCAQILEGYQLAVEFRNRTWFEDKHRERSSGSNPAIWEVTNPALATFRLHERNANTWDKKGLTVSSERFDYEYRETELRQFIPPVVRLAHQAERVHVLFNNNLKDQGIRGARTFSDLLSRAAPVVDQSDPPISCASRTAAGS